MKLRWFTPFFFALSLLLPALLLISVETQPLTSVSVPVTKLKHHPPSALRSTLDLTNTQSLSSVTVRPFYGLVLTMTVSPTTIIPGQTITYNLTLANTGRSLTRDVIVTQVMPLSLTAQHIFSSGVTLTPTIATPPTYTWQVQDLAPGQGGVITFMVVSDPASAGLFTTTAEIQTTAFKTYTLNNRAEAGVLIIPFRLDPASIALPALYGGSVAWGDYDQDQDLDLLLTGDNNNGPVAFIYQNTGSGWVSSQASLPGVGAGSALWGDYDDDGDLDLLLTGSSRAGPLTQLYQNNNGDFTEAGLELPGVAYSSAAWGDYDQDGDLDLLLTGKSEGDPITQVYQNTGSGFTDIEANLPGVAYGSVAWGDYDGDNQLDLLLTGLDKARNPLARVYRNTGSGFTDIGADLPGIAYSSVAWGDYDGDGQLDFLLTGLDKERNPLARVYRNTGSGFTDIGANLLGVAYGSVAWGDYDGDGQLDFLLAGLDKDRIPLTRMYRNTGSGFADIEAKLPGVAYGSVIWGDDDQDGDLDLLIAGYDGQAPVTQVYRNQIGKLN